MPFMVKVSLPDHVFDAYDKFAAATSQPIESLLVAQLERFRLLHPLRPTILINEDVKGKLERLVHGGSLKSAEDLLAKVDRLASIEFAGIKFDFSPGQKEEIVRYADKRGCTVETIVAEIIRGMEGEFFNRSAGDGPVLVKDKPGIPTSGRGPTGATNAGA